MTKPRHSSATLDLDELRLPDAALPTLAGGAPRGKLRDGFVKGPIPLPWITRAAGLPGKALAIGVALWYWSGVKCTNKFGTSSTLWKKFGISRQASYKGLKALEEAGLIDVERSPGKNPIVLVKETAGGDVPTCLGP